MFENQYRAYKPRFLGLRGGVELLGLCWMKVMKKEDEGRTGLNISQILQFIIVDMNKVKCMQRFS